jgi:hypothetical protein
MSATMRSNNRRPRSSSRRRWTISAVVVEESSNGDLPSVERDDKTGSARKQTCDQPLPGLVHGGRPAAEVIFVISTDRFNR